MAGIYEREFSISGSDPDESANIKISVKAIAEYFYCPICRSSIQEASLTVCGHRFCTHCIKEWVGRKHECPICRAPVQLEEIISDKHFDELIGKIVSERKKEEKIYYQKRAEAASESALSSGNSELKSPMESILHKHLKQTLKSHEVYHQQILVEYQRSRARAGREKQHKVELILRQYSHDPDHPKRVQQLKEIEEEWERKNHALTNELARIETLLSSAYDRYLEKNLPPPDTLPVTVKLSVPEKNFVAEDVILKPSDTMDAILRKVEELMREQRMEVTKFPPCEELQISLLNPFAGESEENGQGEQDEEDDPLSSAGGKKGGKVGGACCNEGDQEEGEGLTSLLHTTLHGDCMPVLQYGIKPGSEIKITGSIFLKGEEPKLCFAATFVKGQRSEPIDYFACTTCRATAWICQNCADVCHRGHELVPHRMNHASDWPCCYCPRKKMCLISPGK